MPVFSTLCSGTPLTEMDATLDEKLALSVMDFAPEVVLTGLAGGPDSLDIKTLDTARRKGIPCGALLDASMYYSDRVAGPQGEPFFYLPDRIFVLNDFTKREMIDEGFPERILLASGQPVYDYLADVPTGPPLDGESWRIAFFSEDVAAAAQNRSDQITGYNEETVIETLIEALDDVRGDHPISLTIKRHPKEAFRNKTYVHSLGFDVRDLSEADLAPLLFESHVVCGMTSSLLLEAWLAGRQVVSLQPGLSSWNRLVLCRAGILRAATSRNEVRAHLQAALLGRTMDAEPRTWCPGIGGAASTIVTELTGLMTPTGQTHGR